MTIIEAIEKNARGLTTSLNDKIYIAPNIPAGKLQNAIEGITDSRENAESVVAVLDTTVWGGCGDGVLVSDTSFYYKKLMESPIVIDFQDIGAVRASGLVLKDLIVEDVDGNVLAKIESPEFNVKGAAKLLNDVLAAMMEESELEEYEDEEDDVNEEDDEDEEDDVEEEEEDDEEDALEDGEDQEEDGEPDDSEVGVVSSEDCNCDKARLQHFFFSVGYGILGIFLLSATPWWGFASLGAAILLLLRSVFDGQLIRDGMPADYYVKESKFFRNTIWVHVLLVLGPIACIHYLLMQRKLLRCSKAFIRKRKSFTDLDMRRMLKNANLGMDDIKISDFTRSYLAPLIDNGKWFCVEPGGIVYFFRYDAAMRSVELMDNLVRTKGLASLEELTEVFASEFPGYSPETVHRFIAKADCSFKSMMLANQEHYVSDEIIEATTQKIDAALKESVKVSREELASRVSTNVLTVDLARDLIDQCEGNFENIPFEDGRYFVGHGNMDRVAICPTCGIAEIVDPEVLRGERYFCSDYCRETEAQIDQMTNEIKKNKIVQAGISSASFGGVLGDIAHSWDYNKGRAASLSGKGHGLVAEDANTMLDRLTGHKASVIGTDNAKNGPDRIVDGQLIQTKYCHSAWASVNDAFKGDGTYRYMVDGKPIQLEVPRDQFEQAIKEMEKKILEGKVPGVTDPKEASNLIRKGWLTYQQAQNVCKFGTIESVLFDSFTGAIVGLTAGGISFVLTTAMSYWQTGDIKKALRGSTVIAAQTGGKAFVAYVIGAQVQKIPAVKNFLDSAIHINFGGHGKAVKSLGDGLSKMAGKTKFNNAAANSAVKGAVVTAVATFAVTSVWEIGCYCGGRMSGMQCFKNVVVGGVGIAGGTAAGLYGAAIGTSICPGIGTVVGGLIGGFIGGSGASYVAKKGVDLLGQDDADFIMPLVQSQIQVLAIMFCFSKKELDEVMKKVEEYIQEHRSFIGDVYSHNGLRRQYVTRIFKPMFASVALERPILLASDVSQKSVAKALGGE